MVHTHAIYTTIKWGRTLKTKTKIAALDSTENQNQS